jgi:hypothetical protein
MRKVSDADFAEIGGRLRSRALQLIEQLEAADRQPSDVHRQGAVPPSAGACVRCQTMNDRDAKFCKGCGVRLS